MSAAEFSLYLGIVIAISVLGLAFWSWTQFQEQQRHLKSLESLIYAKSSTSAVPVEEPPKPKEQTDTKEVWFVADSLAFNDSGADDSGAEESDDEQAIDDGQVVDEIIREIDNDGAAVDEVIVNGADETNEVLGDEDIEQPETLDSYFPTRLTTVDFAETKPNEEPKAINTPNYSGMGIKELRLVAESMGIRGAKQMNKKELVEALTV